MGAQPEGAWSESYLQRVFQLLLNFTVHAKPKVSTQVYVAWEGWGGGGGGTEHELAIGLHGRGGGGAEHELAVGHGQF